MVPPVMQETKYRLAPGVEIVRLEGGRVQLRSDFTSVELSGETAAELADHVLSALSRPHTLAEIALRLPGYRPQSLESQLDRLVGEGVLVVQRESSDSPQPFAAWLDQIGLGARETHGRLARCTVAIFGLEAHGSYVAQLLADAGVGHLVLADPFPFEPAHHALTPVRDRLAPGQSREAAVARMIARPGLELTLAGQAPFDRDRVRALAEDCTLLIASWDRGFHAASHWVNHAALATGIPALFSEIRAASTLAGPLVIPGRSACWMCYRMRVIACEKDFDRAMAYEEHLDRKRQPTLASRPLLPGLPLQLASMLTLEALKCLIKFSPPTLVDKVVAFDGLLGAMQSHPVLVKPFCPVCSKRNHRAHPHASELVRTGDESHQALHELGDRFVSDHSGIIVRFASASRDATEPSVPHVWRARLANHCFLSDPEESHLACSGKGVTVDAARQSCLGEALERYSAGCWAPEELVHCRRSELDGLSLDPADLVLYRPEQYASLPYAPYSADTALRWVRGRSLISGADVWVPAIAVFMEYQAHDAAEFLAPVSSNGLAAGPTLAGGALSAIYEVIERDALLVNWLNRLPAVRYDARTHPDAEVRRLAATYQRRGVELALFRLAVDHPVFVYLAIAFQRGGHGGPYATVGMGANLHAASAARAAALEVGQVRPAFRERCRNGDRARVAELVADPTAVKTLEDHALLYADPAMAPAFDFLDGGAAAWPEEPQPRTSDALVTLLAHFRAVGQDVIYVNLTPRDLEPHGVFTVRALIPGFQPIWFGHREPRLGGRRLFELPVRLGFRSAPADVASLNPFPHPLA